MLDADRVDKKEVKKVGELRRIFASGEPLKLEDIFGSKRIVSILEESPLSVIHSSFQSVKDTLPVNCLLYPHIVMTICPNCSCVKNPELMEPYLEKELVLPILTSSLADYNPDFADLIIRQPYIGCATMGFLAETYPWSERASPIDRVAVCPHCLKEKKEAILSKVAEIEATQTRTTLEGSLKRVLLPLFASPSIVHADLLDQIEEAIERKDFDLLNILQDKGIVLFTLKMARIFDAIPQVAQRDLSNIARISQEIGIDPAVVEQMEVKEIAAKRLNIAYSPDLSVDGYLDIILPRRKKIITLLDELISSQKKERKFLELKDKIWEINREVSSSKAIEVLNFVTDFVFDNAKIIFGMLVGGLIGYSSASFLGCGLGSVGGFVSGTVGKLVSKHVDFKIPKYPKKTMELLKEKIEGPEERLLAIMLSKDIEVIQIWNLKRKLEKT